MSQTANLITALDIYKELGWATITNPEDILTLPEPTDEHKKIAHLGLQALDTLNWDSHEWEENCGHQPQYLGIFAIVMGVDAKTATRMTKDQHPKVVAECVARRGERYARDYVVAASTSVRPLADTLLDTSCVAAVCLVAGVGGVHIAVPEILDYLHYWGGVVSIQAGEAAVREILSKEYPSCFPTREQLLARYEEHYAVAESMQAELHATVGRGLVAGVKAGAGNRDDLLAWIARELEKCSKPKQRRRLLQMLTEDLELSDADITRHQAVLASQIAASHADCVKAYGLRLLALMSEPELANAALGALYVPTLAGLKSVLTTLGKRNDLTEQTKQHLFARLEELYTHDDPKVAALAGKLLTAWGKTPAQRVETAPAPAGNWWQPTPSFTKPVRFEVGEVTATNLAAAFAQANYGFNPESNHHIERFWALATQLAFHDRTKAVRAVQDATMNWGNGMLGLVFDEPTGGWFDDYEQSSLFYAREVRLVQNFGEIPCLLSTPSTMDFGIDFSDLIARLEAYRAANASVSEADLQIALMRLKTPDLDWSAAAVQARAFDIPFVETAQPVTVTVGEVIADYIFDQIDDPGLSADPAAGEFVAQAVAIPHCLGAFPDRLNAPRGGVDPTLFPTWVDTPHLGLRVTKKSSWLRCAAHAETVAHAEHVLSPGVAMNLLGALRISDPELFARVLDAVMLAFRRGILLPGTANVELLDWRTRATSFTGLAQPLKELAGDGLLSVVWPIFDDVCRIAAARSATTPGAVEIAQAMADLAPHVCIAVAEGKAPKEALDVPGLRACAAKAGTSKLVTAAQKAMGALGVDAPKQETGAGKKVETLSEEEFAARWGETFAPARIHDSQVNVEVGFGQSDSSGEDLWVVLKLGEDEKSQYVVNAPLCVETWNEDATLVVTRRSLIDDEDAEGRTFILAWRRGTWFETDDWDIQASDPIKDIPALKEVSVALVAFLGSYGQPYPVSLAQQVVLEAISHGRLPSEHIRHAARMLAEVAEWNLVKALKILDKHPTAISGLWPLVTESLRIASENAAAGKLPKWLNGALKVVEQHLDVLVAATARGIIPATEWASLTAIAEGNTTGATQKRAKALQAAFAEL